MVRERHGRRTGRVKTEEQVTEKGEEVDHGEGLHSLLHTLGARPGDRSIIDVNISGFKEALKWTTTLVDSLAMSSRNR